MLRRIIPAGAVMVLLTTGIAFAQVAPLPDNNAKLTKEEQERAAADKAYREAAKTVPASKSPADPWGNVRPNANPPVATKNKQ
jgi:hypothetical protein